MVAFYNCVDHSIIQQGNLFPDPAELNVLVDCSIISDDSSFKKENTIAWIVESPAILEAYHPGFSAELKKRLETGDHNFSKLYTYDPAYKDYPNVKMFEYCPASTWIEKENRIIHNKTKLVSYISSSKTFTPLQVTRNKLLEQLMFDDTVDVYGRNVNPIDKKSDALRDYCFSYAIENCSHPGYFTEKIVDCFITGTVPIYLGDPTVDRVFDPRGFIKLENNQELQLSFDRYYDMMPHIEKNYEIALNIKNEFRDQIPVMIEDYISA